MSKKKNAVKWQKEIFFKAQKLANTHLYTSIKPFSKFRFKEILSLYRKASSRGAYGHDPVWRASTWFHNNRYYNGTIYIIDNVIVLSDLVESSGYSSKTLKDPGRSKYNHTSMESLVDVEYKYIRVNIVFPFHKLQDAERTSHCPPPPSYVTYLVRLAETLMTSFRVGVARDVRPLELLWLARARRVNGFCTQSQ